MLILRVFKLTKIKTFRPWLFEFGVKTIQEKRDVEGKELHIEKHSVNLFVLIVFQGEQKDGDNHCKSIHDPNNLKNFKVPGSKAERLWI